MRKTRIVVPCYNEALRLKPLAFLAALEKEENLSFLFVNDGSTDNTLEILEAMQAKKPTQVEVLSFTRNAGKAEAVRQGILQALDGPYAFVGYWDADLATPLDAIASICSMFNTAEVDLVIGSRVLLLGSNIKRKAIRHYLGRIFATCTSLLLGISIYDSQCGAKIFRNNAIFRQAFAKPFKVSWTFDVELLARLPLIMGTSPLVASAHWVEYPLKSWTEIKGSKLRIIDYLRSGFEFIALFIYFCTPAKRIYQKSLGILPKSVTK